MNSNQIVYATYAHHAKKSDSTHSITYGDLEICLREGAFYFVSKNGAKITNIRQINFTTSILKGITSDITTISPEEQKYYALSAFPKVISIGRYKFCEEFIENFLNSIDQKADRIHTHAINDITNLQTELNNRSLTTHTHTLAISNITNLQTELNNRSLTTHTHPISSITNLQTELNNKSSTSHSHAEFANAIDVLRMVNNQQTGNFILEGNWTVTSRGKIGRW